jgi:cytochrome c oxidase subunit 1
MHLLGIEGMPRRVYTYLAELGWGDLNLLASVGAFILGAGVLAFLVNAAWSRKHGAIAGPDPWRADSLEWATPSPAPSYSFLHLPVVASRSPNWDPPDVEVTGVSAHRRECLVTKLLDAEPDHRTVLPDPNVWPLVAALGTGVVFIGAIFTPWSVPIGSVIVLIAGAKWFWPDAQPRELLEEKT